MTTLLTHTRSTATTHSTHTTHTTATPATTARPVLLHPQRPPSRNKILCEFAQSQTLNSYGSWRFTSSPADYGDPHKDKDSDRSRSRPGSPISSSSSSERHSDDRLGDSTGSPAYHPDVLRARVSRANNSLGSSWGVSSIGKSFDWALNNASDDTGGTNDADTEPTDNDDCVDVDKQEVQEQQQQPQKLLPRLAMSGSSTNQSPNIPNSFGFHSFGSPLSSQTSKNNVLDLTSYTPNLHISPIVPRMTTMTTMTSSASEHSMFSLLPQSPVHSRPISPFVSPLASPSISRAPSSAGSTTSSRFRRRSSQKRISLIAGRISYTPPPSPPPVDTDVDYQEHGAHDHDRDHLPSPRLLRLNSTSSFVSLASTVATAPPTPAAGPGTAHEGGYLGERSISEFVIQGDVGRGAYGLVKRGREVMSNGSYGVRPISSNFFFSTRCGSFGFIASPHTPRSIEHGYLGHAARLPDHRVGQSTTENLSSRSLYL